MSDTLTPIRLSGAELLAAWNTLKQEQPKLRIRNAAQELGVSEAELLAAQLGSGVTRLQGEWTELLERLPEVGKVMALTRNESVVIEKVGPVNPPKFFRHGDGPAMGQVVGPEIDLRLFMASWTYGFEVVTQVRGKEMRSLQFFNAQGDAIFKVYLREAEKRAAWDQLVADYTAPQQLDTLAVAEPEPRTEPKPDSDIDGEGFVNAWAELTDTHQFFGLLRKYSVQRDQALRFAEGRFAWRTPLDSLEKTLQHAADTSLSIMAFVGNRGCLEIHTGPIKKLLELDNWYNVMDPGFNLHVNRDLLAQAWLVEKPTSDGLVSSIEFFDAQGDLVLTLFGERKPGRPELEAWRNWVVSLKPQA